MAKKKTNIYFDAFTEIAGYACKGADFMYATISDFKADEISNKAKEIHAIEHGCDTATHSMMEKLAKEFITPIEREDIIELAYLLDDIVDSLEDVLQRVYMYNIQEIRADAVKIAEIAVNACKKVYDATVLFPNYRKKSAEIDKLIVEVNALESDADALYIEGMHNLFVEEKDPALLLAWKATFDTLESCCDKCEKAANEIQSVIMKNS